MVVGVHEEATRAAGGGRRTRRPWPAAQRWEAPHVAAAQGWTEDWEAVVAGVGEEHLRAAVKGWPEGLETMARGERSRSRALRRRIGERVGKFGE